MCPDEGDPASGEEKRKLAYEALVRRLGSKEQADDFLRRREEWRAKLEADSEFAGITDRLQEEFEVAVDVFPRITGSFLRAFPVPWAFHMQRVGAWLQNRAPKLAGILRRYATYCVRFNVYFRRKNNSSPFEVHFCDPAGWKFHLKVENGQLWPLEEVPRAL